MIVNMYNIRDKIIPSNNIKILQNYLEYDVFLERRTITDIIEVFYETDISSNNIQIISLLNLFVRENKMYCNKKYNKNH